MIVTTRSGQAFSLEKLYSLEEQPLLLDDIAHGLAKTNRYVGQGGAVEDDYSVAEHSVRVTLLVSSWAIKSGFSPAAIRECARWAIMHDASESVLGDLSLGLKRFLRNHTKIYDVLEANYEVLMVRRFGLRPDAVSRQLVKRADKAISIPEREALWEGRINIARAEDAEDVSSVHIGQWKAAYAKARFLEACADLGIV